LSSLNAFQLSPVRPEMSSALGDFFERLSSAGDDRQFHPHPLTRREAQRIARLAGDDVYLVVIDGDRVVAYGILRGWDEGFAVPSLGIAVDSSRRGKGLGRQLMTALHAAARERGAKQVRLKVYPDNQTALELYRSLGYRFGRKEGGQLVGMLELE
jgi:[ribosomal protein S18]-alanine N-acetyltransferase